MQPNHYRLTTCVLIFVALIFSSCLGGPGKGPGTRFFVLNSLYSAESADRPKPITDLDEDTVIGVGPIRVSLALDRPQILIRTSHNEIRVADLARWAMPLRANILNVVSDNLSALLTTGSILKFPWKASIPINYQIVMDITRFDGQPGGNVDLRARWAILAENGKAVLANQRSALTEPVAGDTIAEMVSAQSRLMAKLSLIIAEEIKKLEGKMTQQ
ncbi:MAG: PqiC family protein [Deltaproteobacteria bacterium]|nr:PqiC family protein [Deltaproteobacteria bacterium]